MRQERRAGAGFLLWERVKPGNAGFKKKTRLEIISPTGAASPPLPCFLFGSNAYMGCCRLVYPEYWGRKEPSNPSNERSAPFRNHLRRLETVVYCSVLRRGYYWPALARSALDSACSVCAILGVFGWSITVRPELRTGARAYWTGNGGVILRCELGAFRRPVGCLCCHRGSGWGVVATVSYAAAKSGASLGIHLRAIRSWLCDSFLGSVAGSALARHNLRLCATPAAESTSAFRGGNHPSAGASCRASNTAATTLNSLHPISV